MERVITGKMDGQEIWRDKTSYDRIAEAIVETKYATCERCRQKFDPHWCLDDQMERDNCEECSKIIDNYEQEKSDRED